MTQAERLRSIAELHVGPGREAVQEHLTEDEVSQALAEARKLIECAERIAALGRFSYVVHTHVQGAYTTLVIHELEREGFRVTPEPGFMGMTYAYRVSW